MFVSLFQNAEVKKARLVGGGGGEGVKMLLLQKVQQAHEKSDLGCLRS